MRLNKVKQLVNLSFTDVVNYHLYFIIVVADEYFLELHQLIPNYISEQI